MQKDYIVSSKIGQIFIVTSYSAQRPLLLIKENRYENKYLDYSITDYPEVFLAGEHTQKKILL